MCSIENCERRHYARGWCRIHYTRWQKHGDPLGAVYQGPDAAFLASTESLVGGPGCLIWTRALNGDGYGDLRVNGRMVMAHRYAWERVNGPIPDGMEVDHLCWERSCVNEEHLRLATRTQNTQNRSGARRGSTTGARGVTRNGKGYMARVKIDGVERYLGTFPTIEEAAAVASSKRKELFGEFAGA